MAETFRATLKAEHFHRHAHATRTQAYERVDEWTDMSCNPQRIHTALGGPPSQPTKFNPTILCKYPL